MMGSQRTRCSCQGCKPDRRRVAIAAKQLMAREQCRHAAERGAMKKPSTFVQEAAAATAAASAGSAEAPTAPLARLEGIWEGQDCILAGTSPLSRLRSSWGAAASHAGVGTMVGQPHPGAAALCGSTIKQWWRFCLCRFRRYETTNHLWLILEYCVGGDLMSLLRQDVRLPESSIHDFGRDMVVALQVWLLMQPARWIPCCSRQLEGPC